MSERIHNTDVNDPEGHPHDLHEELCALVLGELDGPAAAKVEAALADSAELREERDRIMATIGLVRSACGGGGGAGGESLSPELLGTIEKAARPAPAPRVWYLATPFRVAAGFAALAGGLIWGKALLSEPPTPAETIVAHLEREIANEGAELRRGVAFKLTRGFDVEVAQGAVVSDLELAESTEAPSTRDRQRERYEAEVRDFLRKQKAEGERELAQLESERDALNNSPQVKNQSGAGAVGPHKPFGGHLRESPFDGASTAAEYEKAWRQTFRELDEMQLIQVEAIEFDKLRRWEQVAGKEATIDGGGYAAPGGGGSGGPIKLQSRGVKIAETPASLGGEGGVAGWHPPADSSVPARRSGGGGGARLGIDAEGTNAAGAPSSGFFYDESKAVAGEDIRGRREILYHLGAVIEDKSKDAANGAPEESLKRARKKSDGPAARPSGSTSLGSAGTVAPPDTEGLAWSEHTEKSAAEDMKLLEGLGYVGGDSGVEPGDDVFFFGYGQARVPVRRELTPAELDELCRIRVDRILQDCRRYPHDEKPSAMFFRFWGDNPFVLAQIDNQSTFGVDVDTASYALARRYLTEGHLPQKAQIRTEEFVNYFKPDVAAPLEGTFTIHTDLAPSRFGGNEGLESRRWMMRVVVRGKEISATERKPVNLTFVVDTSGSMKEGDRLELVKHALRLLTTQLDVNDSIAIIAFSNEARLVLPMTSMANRGVVEAAIYGLQPDGSTNAEAGLRLGYEVATAALTAGLTHRVVLLSDGVANVGQTDQNRINSDVKRNRDAGIYLNTIGVGMGNHNDVFLEQLANQGDGLCNYIDSGVEAKRALVDNFIGAIEPIARDVKIQVEFDKTQVYRHRLLGYENRAIADIDFRNDAIDAGEIGSGHQVVALYELELTGMQSSEPMATVRLRWKQPIGVGRDPLEDNATEIASPVSFASAGSWEGASGGYRRSVLVAQFAEILRRSVHARGDSLDELIAESAKLDATLADPDFTEFLALLQKSRELIVRHTPRHDDLTLCIDAIRRNRILHAQYEELRRTEKRAVIDELERQNAQLEARIRELIRGEVRQELR